MQSFDVPTSQWDEGALEATKVKTYDISLQALEKLKVGLRDGCYNTSTENFTKLFGKVRQRFRMDELERDPTFLRKQQGNQQQRGRPQQQQNRQPFRKGRPKRGAGSGTRSRGGGKQRKNNEQ